MNGSESGIWLVLRLLAKLTSIAHIAVLCAGSLISSERGVKQSISKSDKVEWYKLNGAEELVKNFRKELAD